MIKESFEPSTRIGQAVFAETMRMVTVVDGLATAEVDNTSVLLWRGPVNAERFSLQRASIERVVRAHPGQAAVLCIIEPGSPPPSQELREAASAMLTQLAPKLRCVAYVIEGSGFRAAAVRGVLCGIELIRRNSYTARYFASVEQATTWLDGEGRKGKPLREAANRLRERLDVLDAAKTAALNSLRTRP